MTPGELALAMDPVAYDPLPEGHTVGQQRDQLSRQRVAAAHADAVVAAGYFRVVEDDDTIERVMWAVAAVEDYLPGELNDAGKALYTAMARAAIRALRGDTDG